MKLAHVALSCTLFVASALSVSAQTGSQPPTKRALDPNSITLVNNTLDHLRDAKHALEECSADRDGHHKVAARLLDEVITEVEASKKSLELEIQQYQAGRR